MMMADDPAVRDLLAEVRRLKAELGRERERADRLEGFVRSIADARHLDYFAAATLYEWARGRCDEAVRLLVVSDGDSAPEVQG